MAGESFLGGVTVTHDYDNGMPLEMYGESWIAGLLTSDDVILYMAGFETTRGIYLLRDHSKNYTEVINASSAANST